MQAKFFKDKKSKPLMQNLEDLGLLYSDLNQLIVEYDVPKERVAKQHAKTLSPVLNQVIDQVFPGGVLPFKFVAEAWDAYGKDQLKDFLKKSEQNYKYRYFIPQEIDALDDEKAFKLMWKLTFLPKYWHAVPASNHNEHLEDQEKFIAKWGKGASPFIILASFISKNAKEALNESVELLDKELAKMKDIMDPAINEDSPSQEQKVRSC